MKILAIILSMFLSAASVGQETTFVFAHLNEAIMPVERGEKYEDPLDEFLRKMNIGEVTGGGSSLSESGQIEWVGVDIELANVQKNLPILIREMKILGAPEGSFLEYTIRSQLQKSVIR